MRGPQPWSTNRSRSLRDRQTSAEARLWKHLRNRKLGGFRFARQVPIGPYFADFVCREEHLIVEVDGVTHATDEERAADADRTAHLEDLAYTVVRVTNTEIYENIEGVCDTILSTLEDHK